MRQISNKTQMRNVAALILAFLLALVPAGCGGGGGGAPAPATTLTAILTGTQEVPATTSSATGTATVTVDAAKTTITVNLTTSGLSNVTASHIHFGVAGVSGGIMFSLFAGPGAFPATLTKTLTSADFTATTGAATFADAVNAILGGNAYINVHTQANLGGEIRGQIGPASLAAVIMTGTQEVQTPAVTTAASGSATFLLDNTQSAITVNLVTSGLTNVTASHIHLGKPGANGGIMFSIFAAPASFTTPLTKTLTVADFTAIPASGINTVADGVNAILSGNAYINVHTSAFTAGEIRGQIGPARFTATLSGASEVPVTASTATGTAQVQLDATQTTINVNLSTQGFASPVTASHIHFGATGANGGILFSLFAAPGTFPSPLTESLTSTDFSPDSADGISTYAQAVNAILSGKAYINVHTNANPAGDIRGQLTP
jgi:trimeric autotransporter adhesin